MSSPNSPPQERREWRLPSLTGLPATLVSLFALWVAWQATGFQSNALDIQRATEAREAAATRRTRFTASLEAARKIADAVYLRPIICSITGTSGIQRQPATDRERRQLVALCSACLNAAETAQPSANEILEIAEYLYACGSFTDSIAAITLFKTLSPTISEQVDGQCLLAVMSAAEAQFDSGKAEIRRGQTLIAEAPANAERRIIELRLYTALGTVERLEDPEQGVTPETKDQIRHLYASLPTSPPAESIKLVAERVVPELVPAEDQAADVRETPIVVDEIVAKRLVIVASDGTTEIGRISSDRVSSYLHHDRTSVRPPSTLLFEIGQNSQGGGSVIVRHPSPSGVEIRAWRNETDIMLVDDQGRPAPGSVHWSKKKE
ncbi:MAG: hypothetical protein ACT4QC_09710 [Planctomycetaceae bacterium]